MSDISLERFNDEFGFFDLSEGVESDPPTLQSPEKGMSSTSGGLIPQPPW